ncbi:MAG: peptidoglycan DD-metalloendopeptidase family protein [Oscillospiraceae bacterium]|nr:peptidoglycan DD-metalloendopeptidase family protein [Oscillospiraceae bacterium]
MKKKSLILIIILLLLVILPSAVIAEGRETLEGRRIYFQEQILERNLELEALEERITEALEGISALDERITVHQNEVDSLNAQIIRLTREIEVAEIELEEIEENYLIHKEAFERRLVEQYKAGETRYLDVLLRSSTVTEFVSGFFLIAEMAQLDADLLDSIERQKNAVEHARDILEDRRLSLRDLTDSAQRTIIALENTRIIRNDYVTRLNAEERDIQAQIDSFRLALSNVESEIMGLALLHLDGDFVGGEFAWPSPGNYIVTSRFGMRIHPIFRYSRMHSGVDIGTPMGAPIVAANDGLVIRSTYAVGYGNMVMIDHGGGVITVYGHGSQLIANVGDHVQRGQLIMLAGSTGWSTGPHLHFEIRINGIFIDPLPYITRRATLD